jgi:hypothetical protein
MHTPRRGAILTVISCLTLALAACASPTAPKAPLTGTGVLAGSGNSASNGVLAGSGNSASNGVLAGSGNSATAGVLAGSGN